MSDLPERGSPLLPLSSSTQRLSSPLPLPRRPAHVSQIIVIEQGWSRVWGDLSLHPLPPSSFSLSFSLSDIPAHVVKWPACISFFFSPFPLTLPVTQKSINSFQVRSKARYTVQTCGTIKSSCGQRPGWTDEGRLLPPFTYVWSSRKQTGGDWTWFQPASP